MITTMAEIIDEFPIPLTDARRYGRKSPGRPKVGTLAERFATKFSVGPISSLGTPCLLWTASKRHGYGRIMAEKSNNRMRMAHVVAYEFEHGPVPEGHELHHRCENKSCVNHEHLEAVTPKEHGERHKKPE